MFISVWLRADFGAEWTVEGLTLGQVPSFAVGVTNAGNPYVRIGDDRWAYQSWAVGFGWHHVCVDLDNPDGFYLDGESQVSSRLYVTEAIVTNPPGSDFAVIDRTITTEEVRRLYNGGSPTDLAHVEGLVAWWRMGDSSTPANPQVQFEVVTRVAEEPAPDPQPWYERLLGDDSV